MGYTTYENGDLGDGLLFFYSPSKLWAVMSVVCVQGKTFLEGKKPCAEWVTHITLW